jgi:CRISPR/Cas system-associated exonuclease Cas4 (RecB family)
MKKPIFVPQISYTMLSTFFSCEWKYYLRYIEKIPLPNTAAMVYGSVIHDVIKNGYQQELNGEEMGKIFVEKWMRELDIKNVFINGKDNVDKRREGKEMLLDYYNRYMKDAPAPKVIEKRIGYNKDDKLTIGSYPLIVVFDQIDSEDNIIDMKTGAKPQQSEIDLDLQLTLYSYAFRKIYGRTEKGLIIRHLNSMRDFVTTRNDKDFEIITGEIEKVGKKIKSGIFVRSIGRSCDDCNYLEVCLGKERAINKWK